MAFTAPIALRVTRCSNAWSSGALRASTQATVLLPYLRSLQIPSHRYDCKRYARSCAIARAQEFKCAALI